MAGRAVQEMLDEEAKPNMTSMIDIVFLLLIFFMLMKFKTYEMKLDSHLPKDEGMQVDDPDMQENLTVSLEPMGGDPTRITIYGRNQAGDAAFTPIPWQGRNIQLGERTVETAHPEMFQRLEGFVLEQLQAGAIDSKIVLDPDPQIPFDYVALTLDAVHKAHNQYVGPEIMHQINELEAESTALREQGEDPREVEQRRENLVEQLREDGTWKDITFQAPPME